MARDRAGLLIILAFFLVGCSSVALPTPSPTATVVPSPRPAASPTSTLGPVLTPIEGSWAQVVRVIDGDTIEIEGGVRVRYIGIDTPETYGGVECYGREATAKNRELVEGKRVRLEKDVSETDRYGRLLRYVYVDDVFINAELVRQGFAYASTYPPDVEFAALFVALQREAREADRGLWSACPTSTAPPPPPKGNCDPSYPDVCIPIGADDYDCAGGSGNGPNYIAGPFRVLPPDPHGLDRDGNGIGCE